MALAAKYKYWNELRGEDKGTDRGVCDSNNIFVPSSDRRVGRLLAGDWLLGALDYVTLYSD